MLNCAQHPKKRPPGSRPKGKDDRWETTGYVPTPGTTRKEALAKLTEKIATSNRGAPALSAQGSVAAFLTY
ncbi:hypothetical protein GCM10010305_34890 [Streptomyces termitum]|uniref:Uncharacterized protein n=1 Tax=Streptomyces termitum TaxID=67368 RepID=A0A918T428_9ACTN|nr:hypothetical protein [Streptomyces termitum]GHA88293.1 hypothetical protein GCM10010305_34890 [Streptomyces termitum]